MGEPLQAASFDAPVAQLVEHVLGKDEASGSKPLGGFLISKSSVTPVMMALMASKRGSAGIGNKYARDNSFSMH